MACLDGRALGTPNASEGRWQVYPLQGREFAGLVGFARYGDESAYAVELDGESAGVALESWLLFRGAPDVETCSAG